MSWLAPPRSITYQLFVVDWKLGRGGLIADSKFSFMMRLYNVMPETTGTFLADCRSYCEFELVLWKLVNLFVL